MTSFLRTGAWLFTFQCTSVLLCVPWEYFEAYGPYMFPLIAKYFVPFIAIANRIFPHYIFYLIGRLDWMVFKQRGYCFLWVEFIPRNLNTFCYCLLYFLCWFPWVFRYKIISVTHSDNSPPPPWFIKFLLIIILTSISQTILNTRYCDPSCLSPRFAKNASSFPIKHEIHIYVL